MEKEVSLKPQYIFDELSEVTEEQLNALKNRQPHFTNFIVKINDDRIPPDFKKLQINPSSTLDSFTEYLPPTWGRFNCAGDYVYDDPAGVVFLGHDLESK